MKKLAKNIIRKLLPVEKVMLIFILLTGCLEIFYYSRLPHVSSHLFFRLFLVVIVLILSSLDNPVRNKGLLKTIRVFLPFLFLGFFYKETDYLNNLIYNYNLDPVISRWEQYIFGFQPSLSFAERFHNDAFAEFMYMGYFSYYLICIGIPFYIYQYVSRKSGEKFGFIVITSFLIFYIIYIIFPVAGPQFYYLDWPMKLPDGYIFGPLLRMVQHYGEGATAAFPSSHVSVCLIILIGSYFYAKNLIKIILPVAVLLVFSTVYIRAHYVIDVIAGAGLAPFLYWIISEIYDSGEPIFERPPILNKELKKKLATIEVAKKG